MQGDANADSSRVLIVEDNDELRDLAASALAAAGLQLVGAATAAEAVAAFGDCPDIGLVFTDAELCGEMDGLGLARFLAVARPDLRIIVTSGLFPMNAVDLPHRARFMPKPYSPSALVALVCDLLGDSAT